MFSRNGDHDHHDEEPDVELEFFAVAECEVGECPACGINGVMDLAKGEDRYGVDYEILIHQWCGFAWYRNPKPDDWYDEFYRSGRYREMVSRYRGFDVMKTIHRDQSEYAERLIHQFIPSRPGTTLLDIGGSTGVIAKAYQTLFDVRAVVLDPSPEADEDVYSIQSTLDDFQLGTTWDTILMCQTIDHLTNLPWLLYKVNELLAEDGQFFVDILDFEAEVKEKGLSQTIKIDHPYYFTDKAARAMLRGSGFRIDRTFETAHNHVGYSCSKSLN